MAVSILLSESELEALTGYQKPALQLQELHKQGFTRARVNVRNCLVLERVHYEAVCRGAVANGASIERERPTVRAPLRRAA